MFDRIGNLSVGLVFGIVLMFLFDSSLGLVFGVVLGLGFVLAPSFRKNDKPYLPHIH
ncbi:hypothetical protein [Exiguobacterium sp. ZOR0005]|uniref:hypothetical protein n=1 Tax=Exiguobacterium sp. ZOR0005 TaxID=1339226 RepID=UPI00040D9826|nr:hypothetical protein [Exiguobacterium sp. ZOR0005]